MQPWHAPPTCELPEQQQERPALMQPKHILTTKHDCKSARGGELALRGQQASTQARPALDCAGCRSGQGRRRTQAAAHAGGAAGFKQAVL